VPEPARLWTRRRHRLSLRARLLVTLMTLLTAGLLAADIGTIMALNGFLTDRIDKQLTSAASVAVDMTAAGQSLRDISVGGPSDENGAWELLYRDGVELNMLVVRWSNGTQTRQGPPNLPALPAVFPGTAAHPAIFDAADSSGQDYRVISGPLPGGQGTYAIGMSLANLHSTVRSLIGVEVPLSLGVLIIVGAIGVSSVRRGMRPLDAMAVTARRIGDGDLSRRVDRSDDRTEVGRLGAALNDMLTQLESAFEERRASEDRLRRFVADASHELRTPLASVRGYAELFRRGAASRPDDLATAMRRIESEATRMGVLVDEMLLLARLDSGRPLARDQLDLAALGADAASDSMAADGRWPVTVDAPAPVEIVGDTDRLRQVMANLLANLRRHTPPGTSATLRVSYQDPDTALVELADTGPGMTAEQAGLVFERFYRGDAARTRRGDGGGAGLGLSIVAAIAHAHGGTATLRTAPGAGATFAVTLPVAGPDPDRATATATGAPVSESGVERPRHRDDPQLTAGSQLGHRAGAAESGAVVADNVTTTSEEPTTMHRLSDFVIKHRRLIGLVWLLSLLAGGFASSLLTSRLDQTFNIPGQRSYTANQNIAKVYGNGGSNDPFVPVVTAPAGTRVTDPAVYAGLDKAFTALGAKPGYRVVDYTNTGNPAFLSADHRTTFAIVYPPVHFDANGLPRIQGSATDISTLIRGDLPLGSEVLTTGTTPLANAGSNGTKGIGVLGEVVVGGLGALAVLAFVFASLLALVPLMVAAVSVTTAFLIILGLTTFTDISQIVQYMVGLIGLGVAIDYSLLLVTRWREELGRGADNETAVRRAMLTAGRSVVFSGITVAVGLLVLVALPVPFMRSIGFGGMLIPLVSVLATLTLVPVLLLGAGRRMSWPNRRHEEQPARGWTAWGRFVVRRRWIAAGGALGVLAVLLVAGTGLKVGDASENALAQHGPARDGLVMLQNAGIPVGVLTPIDVYVPASERPDTVVAAASRVPGVFAAAAPTGSSWRQYQTAMVDRAARGGEPQQHR
jgi:signal transduction histidine kinase